MFILVLGIAVLVAVIAGVVAAIVMANRAERADAPPSSVPSDFVAPVSSGGYRFRKVDESPEDFRARIARDNADAASTKR
ncbi:MAG: hypothetical protein U0169_20740 [Polyangiaceae bacterium]